MYIPDFNASTLHQIRLAHAVVRLNIKMRTYLGSKENRHPRFLWVGEGDFVTISLLQLNTRRLTKPHMLRYFQTLMSTSSKGMNK